MSDEDDTRPRLRGHLTVGEAAARLGVSSRTIHRWLAEGRLETAWAYGRRLVRTRDVERLARRRRREDRR